MPHAQRHVLIVVADLASLTPSFLRHLRAKNRSPKTIKAYREAAEQLARFLIEQGMPTDASAIRREHVEAFIEHLLARHSASTAATRYRALQQFFKWLRDEGEVAESPMARMRPPSIPEEPVPMLADDELRRLLAACEGLEFDQRRDTAIVRLFVDSGMRLNEVAALRVEDIDLDQDIALVVGKGRRPRACPYAARTAQAIDRYLRLRARHPAGGEPWLWLGKKGRMTDSGIAQMLRRRGEEAGIKGLHPHQLRHTFAHAGPGGQRRRPHATRRVALSANAPALRGVGGRRAGPGRAPPAQPGGSPLMDAWTPTPGVRQEEGEPSVECESYSRAGPADNSSGVIHSALVIAAGGGERLRRL